MQKWAFVVLVLYLLLVVVVFIPVLSFILLWSVEDSGGLPTFDLSIFYSWQFLIYCGTLLLIQTLFLLFPVKVSEAPLTPKRLIWVPIILTGLMSGILLLGIIWSISMAIWGDDALTDYFIWASLAVVLVSWLIWSRIFYRYSKRTDPLEFSQRTIAWLIKGSILELLIAVPSHIIVRQRKECCAPGVSAYGIAAGMVIMLFAFGPGLYFLFRKRFEAMKPASKRNNSQ